MNTNKNIVYAVMFSIVLTVNVFALIHFLKNNSPFMEHFTVDEEDIEDAKNSMKQFVFKTFDEVHHRNPTQEELEKYMAFQDKDTIEKQIKGLSMPEKPEAPEKDDKPAPVVLDETKPGEKKNLVENAIQNTFKTLDNLNSNITFSKSFINDKINTIQQQLDDIKLLL
jgi:hypothetical protein